MSAQNEGRQSPSPEQSTGAQQNDPTANAKGVDSGSDNKQENKDQLEVCYTPFLSFGSYWSHIQWVSLEVMVQEASLIPNL